MLHPSFKVCPLLLLLFAAPLRAQQAPPPAPIVAPQPSDEPAIMVAELVARALQNSPQLPIARQSEEAARQRVLAARSLPGPTLELVPRIAGNRDAADTEIILSQPLDLFGKRRARGAVAKAQLRAAQSQSVLAQRALIVEVKNAATDLFAAQEAENLGQVQVEVAQQFRDAAARRAQLGDVPPVQVQRADLELLRAQNELTVAQTERAVRRVALNQLIGQAPETPLRVALPELGSATDSLRFSTATPRPNTVFDVLENAANVTPLVTANSDAKNEVASAAAESGIAGAVNAESEIAPAVANGIAPPLPVTPGENAVAIAPAIAATPDAAATVNVNAAATASGAPISSSSNAATNPVASGGAPLLGASSQVGSDLVALRAQFLPSLEQRPDLVGAQATLEARRAQARVLASERRPNIELQARRGSFFGGDNSYALRAVITVPLFDFGSNKSERRALEAEARAQESSIKLLRSQAAAQIEGALLRLNQQRQTVARYRNGIVPQTLDLLRKTRIGYAAGASTYLEVLEAQRTLRQVQTEYLQALVGARSGEAALESALGTDLPANLTGAISNPVGASTPPGVAPPGTVPPNVIPPNVVAPVQPNVEAPQ